jgi:hypothetical protein
MLEKGGDCNEDHITPKMTKPEGLTRLSLGAVEQENGPNIRRGMLQPLTLHSIGLLGRLAASPFLAPYSR